MKNIPYSGSLSTDLKDIDKKYTMFTYFKHNKGDAWLVVVLIAFILLTNAFTNLSLPAVVACYSYSFLHLIKRYKKAKEDFYEEKKLIKERFKKLGSDINERRKMHKVLKRAKVFEHIDLQEEMDKYIEHITSDIYFINGEDKISMLREIKSILSYKEGGLIRESKLYLLDDNELPPKPELPVKQVLKLRKGIK